MGQIFHKTSYLGNKIADYGIPIIQPPGGHAIYIDGKLFLSHIKSYNFPAQALACELYLQGGIRTSEIGSLMFGKYDSKLKKEISSDYELLRLAIPRRTYTQSHIDYVIEIVKKVFDNKSKINGMKITRQPKYLRHFSASLKPIK